MINEMRVTVYKTPASTTIWMTETWERRRLLAAVDWYIFFSWKVSNAVDIKQGHNKYVRGQVAIKACNHTYKYKQRWPWQRDRPQWASKIFFLPPDVPWRIPKVQSRLALQVHDKNQISGWHMVWPFSTHLPRCRRIRRALQWSLVDSDIQHNSDTPVRGVI